VRNHVVALDGLRGVAVAAVVAYHVRPDWVPGGFLGVDLFFVLSGYLITSLLLEEHERSGRIDLVGFAGRRVRRLVPAVLLVVLAVSVYIGANGDLGEIERARRHGLATIGYVANWLFIADGDSYFADVAGPSMLRHVWSLAIEEQFYLLWPLMAWGALRLAGRRAVVGVALAVGAVSVVLMAVLHDAVDPSRAYFGTDTRIFEPLVGAALAVALPLRSTKPQWLVRFGAAAGALWLLMLLLVDDQWTGFYLGGALAIAVVVGAVVIAATADGPVAKLLAWRPLVGLGVISYGVYLWHWPILLVARRDSWTGSVADGGIVVSSVAVAYASHRLVERPVRRSPRLVGWRPVGAAAAAMLLVAGLVVVSTRGTIPAEAVTVDEAIRAIVDNEPAAGDGEGADEVATTDPAAPRRPIVVALVGDSSAWTLGGGLVSWGLDHGPYESPFDPDEIVLLNLARKGYRLAPGATIDLDVPRPRPDVDLEDEAWWRDTIATVEPDLVVALFGLSDLQSREINGDVIEFGSPEFEELMSSAVTDLFGDLAETAPVIVLTTPPLIGEHMPQPVMAEFFRNESAQRATTLNAIFASTAAADDGIAVVDFAALLCPDRSSDGSDHGCLLGLDGSPARHDGVHFTANGGRLAASLLRAALLDHADAAKHDAP
jgi:peptidoglycan/LPS O-acetylase OafA/YrhL/lysophospholipase L1-like esterase